MSTIQNLPENRYNFLRFYPEIDPQIASSQYSEGLHNGYLYRWRKQKDFLPVLVNDTLTFYTNFATDLIGANNVRILEGDTIINNVAKYDLTVTSFGTENSVITLTIPPTNSSNNVIFNVGIVNGSTILYRSNCFILKQLTESNINNTHLISFYNASSVYNYEWANYNVLLDTPYTIRIPSSIKELSYGKEQTVYTSATTGTSRVTRATTSKNYQFETYYNNEDFHDAFNVVSSFKYFAVNGKEFICEEYGIEYQQNMNIFKGVANLRDVEYGRRVNTCTNLT